MNAGHEEIGDAAAGSDKLLLGDRISLFGASMDLMTLEETVEKINCRLEQQVFTQHVVVNVAKVVTMQSNQALADAVNACDIINIDGAGLVIAGRLLGHDIPERVAGIDLFERLLAYAETSGKKVYFLGATQAVIEEMVGVVTKKHPNLGIAGFHHGYFWDDEAAVVEQIRISGADLLFVGIASPMKERFIERWKSELGVGFAMGVGGTFDVISGKVRRAPKWMQRAALEWLFRVLQEPRRMWKRYLVTNSVFLWMVVRELVIGKR